MLISLSELKEKYALEIRGIVHIGAHFGEERSVYSELNIEHVIWIEANSKIFPQLRENVSPQQCFNCLISDQDDRTYDFYVTNNGQSSSLLKLKDHLIHYPKIRVERVEQVKSITLDTLLRRNKLDTKMFNFLNMNIQGADTCASRSDRDAAWYGLPVPGSEYCGTL